MIEPILISPPFGSYLRHEGTTSVLGSSTVQSRPGRALKIAQFIFDNWWRRVPGGWRNRIELRNRGITKLATYLNRYEPDQFIYSIVGLEHLDWEVFLNFFFERNALGLQLELNVGCPNVDGHTISEQTLAEYCRYHTVIMKLPAEIPKALPLAEIGARAGVHLFHCGNTFPSDCGGISGTPLKAVNILTVEEIAERYPRIPIVGGGGIYSFQDLIDYHNAGATHFSLATIWFRPWDAINIIKQYYDSDIYRLSYLPKWVVAPKVPRIDDQVREFT